MPIKVVYYYDELLKNCPAKKYLEQFSPAERDSDDIKERKTRLLIDIDNKIQKILMNNCRPMPPISKPLKEYGVIEILHRKTKDIVIRIIYCRCDDMMVILLGFDKPDDYKSTKIKREIKKQYQIAEGYKKIFFANKNLYETYQ